jgi:hypothetical protein
MAHPSRRTRRSRIPDALERRQAPALLGLAPAAVALYSSPLVSAAGAAATAYQVGQLAYTGHTTLLLGAVRVEQPFALRDLHGPRRAGRRHPPGPAPEPGVRLQVPPLLARLGPSTPPGPPARPGLRR